MDEPTAALGPAETAQVRDLIRQLKAEGIGIFLISHDIHDVFDLSDRISVMLTRPARRHGEQGRRDHGRGAGHDHPRQEADRGHPARSLADLRRLTVTPSGGKWGASAGYSSRYGACPLGVSTRSGPARPRRIDPDGGVHASSTVPCQPGRPRRAVRPRMRPPRWSARWRSRRRGRRPGSAATSAADAAPEARICAGVSAMPATIMGPDHRATRRRPPRAPPGSGGAGRDAR